MIDFDFDLSGTIDDHEKVFASPQWLIAHHEAKLAYRRDFVRRLAIPSGSKILDVACGIGGWSSLFAEEIKESSVIAIDRGPGVLQSAEAYCSEWVQKGCLTFLEADVNALPFPTETFDFVFLANCISYFDNAEQVLRNLFRLIKPNGRMLIRNFDDGLISLYPCDPALNLKVLWGAAQETRSSLSQRGIDPYEGRKIMDTVLHVFQRSVLSYADTTQLSWPFSRAQSIYIAENVRWYGKRAKRWITVDEYNEWMSTIQSRNTACIFEIPSAAYCMVDFCVEVGKHD